jgi:hypothetical protein
MSGTLRTHTAPVSSDFWRHGGSILELYVQPTLVIPAIVIRFIIPIILIFHIIHPNLCIRVYLQGQIKPSRVGHGEVRAVLVYFEVDVQTQGVAQKVL